MTSALQRLQANEDDALWRQNEPVIRQLYQEEKKTLKEVKAIMENEKGFPTTPLSVWEIKLRGFGMQKKLKARDWSLVYQHVRPRLQHEGEKKLRKPTAILINGTMKPWDDCWKEIRRNKALNSRPHEGALPPLPSGIVIRTPSPVLIDASGSTQQHASAQFRILQMIQTAVVSFQPLLDWDSQSNIETSSVLRYSGSVYRLCVEGIPFTRMFEKISDYKDGVSPSVSRGQEDRDDPVTSAVCLSYNQTSRGHATLWASQFTGLIAQSMPRLSLTAPTDQSLGHNFDSYHYLSMVIYLLSNNYVDIPRITDQEFKMNADIEREEDFAEILEMTFGLVSREVLFALLHAQLPSIKAAWQTLLLGAGILRKKEAFKLLINAGIDNDWLDENSRGHEHLYHAVQNDCADIINALLKRGCRAHSSFGWGKHKSAITAALDNGNLDYTMLLIQHCDLDPLNSQLPGSLATNFLEFIVNFDDTNHDHHCCLNFFLEQGADVDHEIDLYLLRFTHLWSHPVDTYLSESWPPSILDFVFYFHRPLFPKLAVFSKAPPRFSRARALLCLEEGVHMIQEYLKFDQAVARPCEEGNDIAMDSSKLSNDRNHCLEILLAEQFLLGRYESHRRFCWKTIQGFLELGIDLAWLSQDKYLAPRILHVTACLITSGDEANKEHGLQILQWLLNQGFQVEEFALSSAVEDHGVAILECLARSCSDLKKLGVSALVEAILRNNFEATKLLLDGGVDVNSVEYNRARTKSMVAVAATGSTFAMMKYLVQRGAELRSWKQRGHSYDFLVDIFRFTRGDEADLFIKVKYIIEEYIPIAEPSRPSSYLLELCLDGSSHRLHKRWPIFQYLLKKGVKLRPGSPLAEWIGSGGRHQLVREMLDSGADPNAYSFETAGTSGFAYFRSQTPLQAAASIGDYTLVCLLLARGADVNQPALGGQGRTALQAICTWDPIRSEERIRKDKIINLFLENGADVNAANSTGHTALRFAAELGDLSTAFALLKHGAKLHAMSTNYIGMDQKTALDAAACKGRLDMVDFLLNANALSWTAFSDGGNYDGAIDWAIQEGHFVVSEMIRKHSADRKRWDVRHGQAVDTGVPPEHTPQAPLFRAKSGTASLPQNERRLTPSENLQGVAVLDQTSGVSYALDDSTVKSSTAASKADGESMLGAEATDVSWARVIGDIDDEAPLADTGGDDPSGGNSDRTATQVFDTRQASSRPRGRLYQAREQNWVEDEQQNVDPLQISSSLGTDVFMGFSECSSA